MASTALAGSYQPVVGASRGELPTGQAMDGKRIQASASSTLCEGQGAKRKCHEPALAIDGERATAWCEGAAGRGEGAWLELTLDAPADLTALSFVPFYAKDFARASANARPRSLTVESDVGTFVVTFEDFPAMVEKQNGATAKGGENDPCGDETCMSRDERIQTGESFVVNFGTGPGVPTAPLRTKKLKLTVKESIPGKKAEDLCLSSVQLFTQPPKR